MIEDIRFALRQLRENPAFAAIAVITLGLGIGAAAAMFGLIQGALLSPPPYADPGRVVLISPARTDGLPYTRGATIGQWLSWRQARSIEAPAIYGWTFSFLVLPEGSVSMGGMSVTPGYFRLLGLRPILGREFAESELARPNVPASAIIIGYDVWQRQFNGDPNIIGRAVRIGRMAAPIPIVGVMPRGIRFLPDAGASSEPNYDVNADVDFWFGRAPDESRPLDGVGNAISRLSDGVSLATAQNEIGTLSAGLAHSDSALQGVGATVLPLEDILNRDGRRLLVPLFGSVVLLFLLACANVAGLLVTRGVQRHSEYAMRLALGASQWRLFRQTLIESLVVAIAGGILGAGLATGIVLILKAIAGDAVPRIDAVHVGWPMFGFGLAAALVATGITGTLPAVRASFTNRFGGVTSPRSTVGPGERRILGGVVTLQIVLTIALLAGGAVLFRSANNLNRLQPGYDTESILAMTVTAMDRQKSAEFHKLALERVASIPGVTHAAFAWGLPLTGNNWPGDIVVPGLTASSTLTDRVNVSLRSITGDYFDVMGIAVTAGRVFRDSDGPDSPRVAIVNATLAKRYFADRDPIGAPLQLQWGGGNGQPLEIIGVVADARTADLTVPAGPEVYLSFWQSAPFSKHLVIRASSDPAVLAPRVRAEMRAIEPTVAVEQITTMAAIRRESTAARTFAIRLLIGFGVVAALLAAVGLYGVLSLMVNSRIKEIAVRQAIGARRHEIVRLVAGGIARFVGAGLILGAITAAYFGRLLQTWLFEIGPSDPLSLGIAVLAFGAVTVAAGIVPAYRATRVDLSRSLRQQ